MSIEPQGFDTLGGLLFSRLGRIPTAGDIVEEAGLRMQVTATAGRRIKKVRVSTQIAEATADEKPESEAIDPA